MSNGPLSNPTPTPGVNAYDEDPDVQRPMDGSRAREAAEAHKGGRHHTTPDHKAGAGTASDHAAPDLRGQDRHPATGQYR
jgi:hypothetical protein